MTPTPSKVKIKVRPYTPQGQAPKKKEEPTTQPIPKRKKSIIIRIGELISSDIRNLPDIIWGKKNKVKMPESKESWKDWENQL